MDSGMLEAKAMTLGLIVDSMYYGGQYELKVRSRRHIPYCNAHGLFYQSRDCRFSTENGIRLRPDQVEPYLSAYAADPNAGPFVLMERCGIDPFSNWKTFG